MPISERSSTVAGAIGGSTVKGLLSISVICDDVSNFVLEGGKISHLKSPKRSLILDSFHLHVAWRRVGSNDEGSVLAVHSASHSKAGAATPHHLGFENGLLSADFLRYRVFPDSGYVYFGVRLTVMRVLEEVTVGDDLAVVVDVVSPEGQSRLVEGTK